MIFRNWQLGLVPTNAAGARAMQATLSQEEYAELKEFLGFYSSRYMQVDSLPPELRPVACLEVLEGKSLKQAREGLRQAVNDVVERTRRITLSELARIDSELARNGIISLSRVRARYSKDLARMIKSNKIANETEYYLARGVIDDLPELSEDDRKKLVRLIKDFELRAVGRPPKSTLK